MKVTAVTIREWARNSDEKMVNLFCDLIELFEIFERQESYKTLIQFMESKPHEQDKIMCLE
jgi:hypothetical protein